MLKDIIIIGGAFVILVAIVLIIAWMNKSANTKQKTNAHTSSQSVANSTTNQAPIDGPDFVQYDMLSSNWVRSLGIVIVVVAIIAAILLGFVSGTVMVSEHYPYRNTIKFNWTAAIAFFAVGALSSLMFFVVGTIIDRQNETINVLREISAHIQVQNHSINNDDK